ncbi:unnamed protein product [Rotaria sp. Silwood2]|nr:unnamed protein product [Rotaria sp. Silwood2]CAF4100868.1 unnamed protein product [Rotaria sp. Silwood2]CAF4112202.1 unnamed protein product [Rotaria sp. Silwood2]CAF4133675.1 unnamed protein product [Rotaria sp. Silwood2]
MDTTDIGITSTTIDTTTTAAAAVKRRDPPPLNVYVRIRPFIGDELERGENQKLLQIIDEKHVSVKVCPATNNTIRNIQASYNEYEVSRIFDHRCTQKELFEQILEQPTNEIFTGSNWLLCTLGLTNSGKTHTMFGTAEEPGLIPQCLQRIFLNVGQNIDDKVLFKPDGLENLIPTTDSNLDREINARNYIFKDDKKNNRRIRLPNIVQQQNSFEDLSIEDEYYSVWISFFELYNENILDLLVQPKDMKTRKNLRLMQNDHSTIIKNLIQIPVFDIREAEDIIKFGYSNRATSKTNLNEASSRSHAVLCITLITINEFHEEPIMSHMYICDLAGNEPSTGTGKQLAETCNINTSLMTFKDCIRTLNENQTTKKQMLVPYRNSILTSIFRPFFVGRGRTIICCNVNPCAAFVTQTNDLLKFCALAQKTIIVPNEPKTGAGGLIRQKRKSKQKGPKRLVKDGPLKEKNKKDIINIDEEIEEIGIQSIDGSSFTIPTNTKSINYWKYCTKKALDLLQKQASNRRILMIQLHKERVQTVQYLLHQREQIDTLTNEKQALSEKCETLLTNFRLEEDNHHRTQQLYNDLIITEKQYRQKLLKLEKEFKENNLHSRNEIDLLQTQLKNLQQQFEQLTREHLKTIEEIDQNKNQSNEYEQTLQDEIQRLKRDFGLELYRKQDAEKKARSFEDKLRHEQTQLQKVQYDFTQTKHDLKTLQVKYDALQLELIEMHKNIKTNSHIILNKFNTDISRTTNQDQSCIQTQQSITRTKRRTNDENQLEQEIKKPKRVTRSRSAASSNNTSLNIHQQDEQNNEKQTQRITRNGSTANSSNTIQLPIKQTKKKSSNIGIFDSSSDIKIKPKTAVVRGRTKKQTIELVPITIQQQSPSHTYATIERDISLDRASFATIDVNSTTTTQVVSSVDTINTTPKQSAFKRIQSLFRPSPTLTTSTRINRVLQAKSTVIAFGSSTPTQRMPPTIIKTTTTTPAPIVLSTPAASTVKKIPSPKGKYNLRTRLFANPTYADKDEDEKKSRTKKPLRTRK